MAEKVSVREIDDEGRRLLRIVRRGTGSVVTWRRAQMMLRSAQAMPVARTAEVTFTGADRVRDVIHNFNADGFAALYLKYRGGRPLAIQSPSHRAPCDVVLALQRTLRHALLMDTTDRGVQIDQQHTPPFHRKPPTDVETRLWHRSWGAVAERHRAGRFAAVITLVLGRS